MKQQEYLSVVEAMEKHMRANGFSQLVLEKNRWVLNLFADYSEKEHLEDISLDAAGRFIKDRFGFNIYSPEIPIQTAIRFPLLTLFEFYQNGQYAKKHNKPNSSEIPHQYDSLYQEFAIHIDGLCLKKGTKQKKKLVLAKLLNFLDARGIQNMLDMEKKDAYDFIESMDQYAPKTLNGYRVHMRSLMEWLHEKGEITFTGWEVLPVIHYESRSKLTSYYSREEISQILSSIDTNCRSGKFTYCVVCFFAYLGMRAGDVIRLRFTDIDWAKGQISFTQYKTKNHLTLPLLDEVRYPLIDYIKNGRYESSDKEHIFIRLRAPHIPYQDGGILYEIVRECIEKAGIDTDGRHRGPHALRHSLATNLMSNNVPLSEISDILGHTSTITTEIYLTIDETHLKEVSLEVPNA